MDYSKAKNKEIIADLCDRLEQTGGRAYEMSKQRPELAAELDGYFRELIDIKNTLQIFILPYFENLGTQKSLARATASRANGKKGGRPPKRIAELKRQIADLAESETAGKESDLQRLKDELDRLEAERQKERGAKND